VNESQIDDVAQHLTAVLARERREAIAYASLTVLCTPAFVAIASVVFLSIVLYVFRQSHFYRLNNALAIYTGMTVFLASTLAMMAPGVRRSAAQFALDRTWLAGVAIFLILLAVTYMTPLGQESPAVFGIVYCVLGLLVLGLVGRTYLNSPPDDPLGETPSLRAFVLAIMGFVVSAYAELLSGSWLWIPPEPHEIRIAARVLCRLAADGRAPLHECVVDDRIERLLIRLKLLQRIGPELHLTPKGLDFVRTATRIGETPERRSTCK